LSEKAKIQTDSEYAVQRASDKRSVEHFRQQRQSNELTILTLEVAGDSSMKLVNWSRTGVGFETYSKKSSWNAGDLIEDIIIRCGKIEIYKGSLEIRQKSATETDRTYYGASFVGSLFPTEAVDSALAVNECISAVVESVKSVESVNTEFSRYILALRAALRTIKHACDQQQERWTRMTFDQRCEAEQLFAPQIVAQLKHVFFDFNSKIATVVDLENIPENSPYHKIFQMEVYPYFQGADLVRRAFEKPRGYAGDYEMMNQIYRNSFEGHDLFSRILHHYIANENSGESVKFRRPYLASKITASLSRPGTSRVLVLASGPAMEVQDVIKQSKQDSLDRLDITLLDLDREALEHAQTKIFSLAQEQNKRAKVHFVHASIKKFLTSAPPVSGPFDLIYSAGLFDYLDNPTSTALVERLATLLGPNGRIVIGNFTKENKTKAFLHLLTHWTLNHKTEDEIRSWAKNVPNSSVTIEFDPLKMNAFLVLKSEIR
jgi:extracellular factor (EF) 3-hydroxypalmitic acid methyl ester biosynthesis protein